MTVASFRADKNGSNQTSFPSGAFTQVTFSNEQYDNGGYFASSAWTPPSGYVRMMAQIYVSSGATNNVVGAVAIYKDGAIFQQSNFEQGAASCGPVNVVVDDNCNGSNAYTVYAFVQGAGMAINGTVNYTWFAGYRWAT